MPLKKTVLSLSHDFLLQRTRILLLERSGHAVVPAAPGEEALRLFRQRDFDLVLLCHSLSRAEKTDVVSKIRAHNASVPILVFHGSFLATCEPVFDQPLEIDSPSTFLQVIEKAVQEKI